MQAQLFNDITNAAEVLKNIKKLRPAILPEGLTFEIIDKIAKQAEYTPKFIGELQLELKEIHAKLSGLKKITQEQINSFPENASILLDSEMATLAANAIYSIVIQLMKK